jgi:lipoprotein-releasing system permease protein
VLKAIRFELRLALRHLHFGGGQTLLTVSAVAVGVSIVIFITGLIFGLQQKLTALLIETLPHITLQVKAVQPMPLAHLPGAAAGASSSRIEQQDPPQKHIDNWPQVADIVRRLADVRLVAPAVKMQGFASRGGHVVGVSVVGVDPALQDAVAPVSKHLIAGHYLTLRSEEVVIAVHLAEKLQVATGDRLRLTSSTGTFDTVTIVGISGADSSSDVYVTLRTAQRLFGLETAVNTILVKLVDVFAADRVADHLTTLLPYEATSWSREFPNIRTSLRVQSAVAYIISGCSLLASAFAMASVLVVSVLQKSPQIGILKSMGARRQQILRIFIFEGLGMAIVGSVLGVLLGTSMTFLLSLIRQPVAQVGQGPEPLLPVIVLPGYIALAVLAAIASTVLAAILPARHAARLNPVEVIR